MAARKILPQQRRLDACTEFALGNPQACALFLDVDGTLLELAPRPQDVKVPEGLIALLQRLFLGLDGAIAIVTGQLISDIDFILSPVRLTAAGVHGAEMRTDPNRDIEQVGAELPEEIVKAVRKLAHSIPGVIAEPKGAGLALHYRLAPEAEGDILAALTHFLTHDGGTFDVVPGKKIFEVVPRGLSKGTALARLAELPAFEGRVPIMIGDDIGDVPAFAAAEARRGFGLRVAGEQFAAADADFSSPRAVMDWLDAFSRRLAAEVASARSYSQ